MAETIAEGPAGRRGGGHRPRAGAHTRPPPKETNFDSSKFSFPLFSFSFLLLPRKFTLFREEASKRGCLLAELQRAKMIGGLYFDFTT